jgi:hypothetical protein
MTKYICTRKCFFQERLYEEGEILNWAGDKEPPHHFKRVNGDISIAKVKKEETVEEAIEDAIEDADKDVSESLRTELDAIGSAYDRRWGKTKLEHALILARKERGE